MNEYINAIILGIVQGLTEFLPVSSSGHLEIAKYLLGDQQLGKQSLLMTVVLHFATALSTVVIFYKDILEILRGLLQFRWNTHAEFCLKIAISMIPAAVIGVLFNDQIEALFGGRLLLVGTMLVVTGILLLLADRATETEKSVGFTHAILIGISQAIAILPGISRSGATISTSVLLGIDREKAARFSFLMVVPLIFGKMAKDVLDSIGSGETMYETGQLVPLAIGFTAAFLTGLIACKWMIQLVKSCNLYYFSVYCFVVAAWAIFTGVFQ
ncbi:MAG: undecaprenyl-diphosphate phosphatase [Planctomycetota bacterium]